MSKTSKGPHSLALVERLVGLEGERASQAKGGWRGGGVSMEKQNPQRGFHQPQGQRQPLVPMETSMIQKYLEDNAKLLKVIMEKQSMGRWEDCEE